MPNTNTTPADDGRKGPQPDPDCELCGGYGEYFTHADDCWSDDCVLALGIDDCDGQVVECPCLQNKDTTHA